MCIGAKIQYDTLVCCLVHDISENREDTSKAFYEAKGQVNRQGMVVMTIRNTAAFLSMSISSLRLIQSFEPHEGEL